MFPHFSGNYILDYLSEKSIGHYVLFYNLFGDEMKLRIKDLREDNDLTQKEVAKVLMCDQSLYSKYERGEREIPLSLLIKLADCYGTSLDYLTCRTDNPNIK